MKKCLFLISFLLVFMTPDDALAKVERLIVFEEGVIKNISSSTLYKDEIQLQFLDDRTALATFEQLTKKKFNKLELILHQSPFVETIESNSERSIDGNISFQPNDPLTSQQWWVPELNMSEVWKIGQKHAKYKATIAVIDSGVNREHPDLQNERILPGFDFITNSHVEVDLNGHGTSIIGLLQATTNNNKGISSLLHEYPVNILPLRIMDAKGITKISSIVQAIDFAIQQQVDVINLSLGGAHPSVAEQHAIEKAINHGILVVASAGNDALKGNPMNYPAAYPNVVGVGSITPKGQRAPFSNFHDYVDFVAPGTNLLSTNIQNTYSTVQGTSFSTPFVSALASMICSIDPTVTKDVIYSTLQQTARPLSKEIPSDEYGYGVIQFVDTLQFFTKNFPKVVWSSSEWHLPLQYETNWLKLDEHHYAVLLEVGETINFQETITLTTNRSPIVTITGQSLRANAVGATRFKLHQLNGPTKTIDVKVTNNRQHTLAGFTKESATWEVSPIENTSSHPDGLIHLSRAGDVNVRVITEETQQSFTKKVSGFGLSEKKKPYQILRPKHSKDELTLFFNKPLNETFIQEAIELSTDEWNEHPWDDVTIQLKKDKVIIKPNEEWPKTPIFIHVHDTKLNDQMLNNPQTSYFQIQKELY